jgi:hypothetical protein
MKRLDQDHLHLLLEHPKTNMSRPGIEPRLPASQASTLAKKLFEQLFFFGTSTITYISRLRDERNRDTTFRDGTFRDGQAIVCNFLLLLKFHVSTIVGIKYCNIIWYLEAQKNVIKGFYTGSLNLICCTCHSTKPTSLRAQKQSFIFSVVDNDE